MNNHETTKSSKLIYIILFFSEILVAISSCYFKSSKYLCIIYNNISFNSSVKAVSAESFRLGRLIISSFFYIILLRYQTNASNNHICENNRWISTILSYSSSSHHSQFNNYIIISFVKYRLYSEAEL